jgi:ribokinase
MYDFLSIGDTQLDTVMALDLDEVDLSCRVDTKECEIAFRFGSKLPVKEMQTMVAGNAANAAIAGVRLNGKTAFWTMLGDDEVADMEIKYFEEQGVDSRYIRKTAGTKSNRSTVISVEGERTILVYHDHRKYDLPHDLPTSKWVYLTSMAEGSESVFGELAEYLEKSGAKLAFQPGTFQLRLGPVMAKPILGSTEYIIMNKEEAQLYTGLETDSIPHLIEALHDMGPKIVVVTDGTAGSYASDGKDKWFLGVRPDIPRIEATGAGDAYASAFAIALMNGHPVSEAMRWGTFNAESVIQQFGPQAGILEKFAMQKTLEANPGFQAKKLE